MRMKLKPIDQQVIVLAGASSGIGLTTAKMAARQGATVVLAARQEDALRGAVDEINAGGRGRAAYVVADVANESDVARIAETAIAQFGGFDTWVNIAAVAIYGRALEVDLAEARRLMDVNFFGQVHGSLTAVRHLAERGGGGGGGGGRGAGGGGGGALINIGSIESDRGLPLHSYYSASKHAVRAFTDVLRMEVEEAGMPVSITLIKPGSINTPFVEHAKNYMDREPSYPPPVYAPEVVARAILHCAQTPEREVYIGGGGKLITAMGHYAPRTTDRFMERTMFRLQRQDRPSHEGDNLAGPMPADRYREHGNYPGITRQHSFYTTASLHPWLTGFAIGAAGALLAGIAGIGAQRMRDRAAPPTTERFTGRRTAERLRDLIEPARRRWQTRGE